MAGFIATPSVTTAQSYRAPGPYDEDYRSIARREQMAQILQQQALQPLEAGSYQGIQAPISPLSGIAKVLQGYLAGQQMDEVDKARQDLMLKATNQELALSNLPPMERPQKIAKALEQQPIANTNYGEGPPPSAQPMAQISAQTAEPIAQAMPVSASGMAQTPVQATSQTARMPMLNSDPRINAMLVRNMGQQEYLKALVKQLEPTSEMKNIAAIHGVGSPEYQKAMNQYVFKQGYVAPTTVAEGAALIPAGQSTPTYIGSKGGIQQQFGPNGLTAGPILGYGPTAAEIERQQAAGKGLGGAQTTPATRIDENQNVVATTQAENMGLPTLSGGQPSSTKPVVVGINPVVTKAGEQINQNWITSQLEPAQVAGIAAKSAIDNIRVLKNIDLTTGFGTEAQKNAANVLATFGVKDAAKFATNAQIFESKVYESLVDTLSKQKGPQTDKDFTNIQKTYAQLQNTPQANQFLLDVAEAKAMEDQRKANYYQEAAAMPSVRGNLSSITNAWQKHSEKDSLFNVPLTDKAGRQYTLSQKYGIK